VGCGGELRPWGYVRWPTLRDHGPPVRLRPRRSRCRSCRISHVLLPTPVLLRRVDLVAVIGAALVSRHVEGRTRAEVARAAGAPSDAVRGLRRFGERAVEIRAEFATLAHRWDAEGAPSSPGLRRPGRPGGDRGGSRGGGAPLRTDSVVDAGSVSLWRQAALQHELPRSRRRLSRSPSRILVGRRPNHGIVQVSDDPIPGARAGRHRPGCSCPPGGHR
jgi:hypothetical protein